MPDPDSPYGKTLDQAVFALGVHLARRPSGPLADLRRMQPGDGAAAFWRTYYEPGPALDRQPASDVAWEWVVHSLALLTPTGNDPNKRSVHDGAVPLGRALHDIGVSEARMSGVLNATPDQRREALLRLVRMLARERVRFDTTDLAQLLLFDHADPRAPGNALRRLARSYYAADAAAKKEDTDA